MICLFTLNSYHLFDNFCFLLIVERVLSAVAVFRKSSGHPQINENVGCLPINVIGSDPVLRRGQFEGGLMSASGQNIVANEPV